MSERSKQSRRAEASSGSRSDGGGRRRTWTLLVVAAGMGDEGRVAVMPPSRVMSLAMGSVIVAGALSAPADGSTALAPPPRSRWWMAAGGSAVVVLGGLCLEVCEDPSSYPSALGLGLCWWVGRT